MTTLFRSRRSKIVAKLVTFVWLVGFAAALANACAVRHAPAAAASPQHQECAQAAQAALAASGDDLAACQAACRGLCESGQDAVATTKSVDGPAAALMVAMPVASSAHLAACCEPRWRATAAPPPPGPPVAILFLRLTI